MGSLYDRTDIYDLLENENRYIEIKRHWQKVLENRQIHSVLDVSIGTGNLTLPLCELGIRLYGSDLSKSMLEKCEKKAADKGFEVELKQGDFRELSQLFDEKFDCVASTGNSLPYVNNEEILQVLEQMDGLVHQGGFLYFDMRNWDKILKERNRFYLYNPAFIGDTRVNLIQVWDYNADVSMTFHLLYSFEKENCIVQKEKFEEHYYPVRRELLINKLKELGYSDIQILCHPVQCEIEADKADWYCVIAKKGKEQ